MYYQFDDDDRRFESIADILDYCVTVDYYMDDADGFDEWIEESEGTVEICGREFSPAEIFRSMDNYGYEQELQYWAEQQVDTNKSDYRYELEQMTPGDHIIVCNYTIYAYADEEDEDTDGDDLVAATLELLKQKLDKQKEDEARELAEQSKVDNDFLSALGIQVI